MSVRLCVRASVRTITCIIMHGLQNNFGTALALEEEKCHLKHFRYVEGQGQRSENKGQNGHIHVLSLSGP